MLNDLIVIEKRVKSGNCISGDKWEKELSCWACREKIVTTEEYIAQSYRTNIETTYKIRKSLSTEKLDTREYRIVHKGKIYDIKNIMDDIKGDFLKIQCKLVS